MATRAAVAGRLDVGCGAVAAAGGRERLVDELGLRASIIVEGTIQELAMHSSEAKARL